MTDKKALRRQARQRHMEQEKRKQSITRDIKLLKRRVCEQERTAVEKQIQNLKVSFESFEKQYDSYHQTLSDKSDIDNSLEDFDEIETMYMSTLIIANSYLNEVKQCVSLNIHEKILQLLDNQTNLAHLTLSVFDGSDVLEFMPWITIFDETVDSKNIPKPVKLARLLQYTRGTAHRQIRHCPLDKVNGYDNARKILCDTYGAPHLILHKTVENLKCGPPVSTGMELTQLGNDLQMALHTVIGLELLTEIDNQLVIRDILNRCPKYLQTKYRDYATEFKIHHSSYPSFKDFTAFVQKWAVKQSDPIWSTVCEYNLDYTDYSTNHFSSTAVPDTIIEPALRCVMCDESHLLYQCPRFKSLEVADRLRFVEDKELCLLCFSFDHVVEQCRSKYRCTGMNLDGGICNAKHSRSIHRVPDPTDPVSNDNPDRNIEHTGSASLMCENDNVFPQNQFQPEILKPPVTPLAGTRNRSDYIPTARISKPGAERTIYDIKRADLRRPRARLPYSHSMQSNRYRFYKGHMDITGSYDSSLYQKTERINGFDHKTSDVPFCSNTHSARFF